MVYNGLWVFLLRYVCHFHLVLYLMPVHATPSPPNLQPATIVLHGIRCDILENWRLWPRLQFLQTSAYTAFSAVAGGDAPPLVRSSRG